MPLRLVTDHEERRRHAELGEVVEDTRCVDGVGSVVKGQRDDLTDAVHATPGACRALEEGLELPVGSTADLSVGHD